MTEPPHSYEGPWRARITTAGGAVAGAGILVGRRTVLTAARVVGADEQVTVDIAGATRAGTVTASFRDADRDLAVLQLDGDAPRTSRTAPLATEPPRGGQRLSAYGYPSDGRWLDLVVPRPLEDGTPWLRLVPVGGTVTPEFSGAGVVDADMRVVGMLVARRNGSQPWLVPAQRIVELLGPHAGEGFAADVAAEPAGNDTVRPELADAPALRALLAQVSGDGTGELVVLTGARGSGKSLLMQQLQYALRGRLLLGDGLSVDDLRRRLTDELDAPAGADDARRWQLLRQRPAPLLLDALGRAQDPLGIARHLVPLVGERTGGTATMVVAGRRDLVGPLIAAGAPVVDLDDYPPVPGAFAVRGGYSPRPTITRDFWTLDDRLSYRYHAQAIASFLRHPDTRPPLTIGVKGAWGAGKTSLMRMVQDELDPGVAAGHGRRIRFDPDSRRQTHRWQRGESGRVTNAEVLRGARDDTEPHQVRAESPARTAAWRPTVWFNPWVYQNGDQVWAGLAHEIIEQVTRRLSTGDRERFWLRLNLARTDREQIRRWWYRLLLGRLAPLLVWWLGLTAVAVAGSAAARLTRHDLVSGGTGVFWGTGTLALVLAAVSGRLLAGRAAASGPLSKLVRAPQVLPQPVLDAALPDPGYGARLGFLHLVHADIRRVLDLVATPDRPLVVFIDDLDRCSPGTVAQVIEAVNLFLAGEFPNCVFVVAMEPAAVAAHVEVAYRELAAALDGDGSALGWRFLEKIVQLPLNLPALDRDRDIEPYLDEILDVATARPGPIGLALSPPADAPAPDRETEPPATAPPAAGAGRTVDELVAEIVRRRPTVETLREVAAGVQADLFGGTGPLSGDLLIAAERVFAELYSDAGARDAIRAGLPALRSDNPRELKRYVNLFRFYTFVAEQRRLRGSPAPGAVQVAKLAAFAIRWPQLLSLLDRQHTVPHPLARLESAAPHDEEWARRLAELAPGREADRWAGEVRTFLRTEPVLGALTCDLL